MRSWVWTSPSSVKVFEAGWCVVARPALLYPLDARCNVSHVMCPHNNTCRNVPRASCREMEPG